MKIFSLAVITGTLIFSSSPASAGPRHGPGYFRGHSHMHLRGGFVRSGPLVVSPLAGILSHCAVPSPAIRYAPRGPVVTHRSVVSRVNPAPSRAAPTVTRNPQSSGGNSSRPNPNGQGNGGNGKPSKPSKPSR